MKLISFFNKEEGSNCIRAYISIYRCSSPRTTLGLGICVVIPFYTTTKADFDKIATTLVAYSKVINLAFRYRTADLSPRLLGKAAIWTVAL